MSPKPKLGPPNTYLSEAQGRLTMAIRYADFAWDTSLTEEELQELGRIRLDLRALHDRIRERKGREA